MPLPHMAGREAGSAGKQSSRERRMAWEEDERDGRDIGTYLKKSILALCPSGT